MKLPYVHRSFRIISYKEEFGTLADHDIRKLIKEAVEEANARMPLYKRIRKFEIRKTEFEKTASKKIKRHAVNRHAGH